MKHAAFALAFLFAVTASAQQPAPAPPSGIRAQVGIHVAYPLPLSGDQPIATNWSADKSISVDLLDVVRTSADSILVKWSWKNHTRRIQQVGTRYLKPLERYETSETVAAPPAGTKIVTIAIPGVEAFNVRMER